MNEGVAEPDGEPLWTTWSLPRAVHDNRAARVWKSAEHIRASDLLGLSDKGYVGLSELVFCPFKGRDKPQWEKDSDSEHTKLRSLASARSPSPRTGTSCAGCGAVRTRLARSPERYWCFNSAKQNEKAA
ncbi:hypothetical protein [Nocardiopsis alba]|uniref:hypothetical protein n=1 Tax=Nocardiopsis alba TaxID=53437 RepID=UPI0035D64691